MYSVSINEENFSIEQQGDDFLINGELASLSITAINDRRFQVIKDQQAYEVELLSKVPEENKITLKINNKTVEVGIKDKMALLLEKLGMNGSVAPASAEVRAPMPGLILEIQVKVGEEVTVGQPLLILEAMKMENIIKSPQSGTISSILATKGNSVEKNQLLVQF
ncbi:acetyl-CoA carboxylase biotin carboxyl carrier protein subunit [Echinicola pacifica]|uniref:Acetyl-CoA carboxylase biotin carboxyl carrier protein subunit n=1 Tax=Echinicola pacifica TaxID=346377 RepID=A0A918QA69_9BACT|nr:acetyl-CoA carboxylase biotin carboxyl carrier protein subunit [Echinicola pacifica]GGZ36389.1 acetyl-CoA carboxylase biotin carboxyl carrier protein subunit [Echinicola pacifica]